MKPRPLPILIDTREQMPLAFPATLQASGRTWAITTRRATLSTGDYSIDGHEGGKTGQRSGICIERKQDLEELAGCFTAGRERFEREFARMELYRVRIITVVGSRADIMGHRYRSRMVPQSLLASLDGWCEWFGVHVHFAPSRREMSDYILQAMRRYLIRIERIESDDTDESTAFDFLQSAPDGDQDHRRETCPQRLPTGSPQGPENHDHR